MVQARVIMQAQAQELDKKQIQGITFRQVIAYTVTVATVALVYGKLTSTMNETQGLVKQLIEDRKEERRVNDIRLTSIEQTQKNIEINQRVMDINVKNIQSQLDAEYNTYKKK